MDLTLLDNLLDYLLVLCHKYNQVLLRKNDLSFKKIFGSEKNKNILIHFLNDILRFSGDNEIKEIEFLSTIMDPEIASDKQSIVDVLCKDSIGHRFVIEIQLARDKGFEKRAQLYAAKAYSRQLDKSGNYIDLEKVFFIAISNCNLLPDEVDYVSTHNIRDVKTNGHYLKDFQFFFIELPKFTKSRVEQLQSIVDRWLFFFKYAEETTDEDLRKIAEKAPIIKLAYDELDKFRWNEKDLIAYEERIVDLREEEGILALDDATEKGRQEGVQIGHEKGKEEKSLKTYLKQVFPLISSHKRLVSLKLKLYNSRKKYHSDLCSCLSTVGSFK